MSWSFYKHDCQRQFLFLVGWFLKIFSSETSWPNKAKFYRQHLWNVLYKIASFHPSWAKNMVAMGNSCFWLAKIKQIFSSETRRHNERSSLLLGHFFILERGGSCKRGTTVTSIFNVDVVFYSYFLHKIDIVWLKIFYIWTK